MTHHTRQSAIGLPLIREKTYGGKTCSATEYTMSEILASIYDQMEQTGQKTGFLVPRRDQLRLRNAGSRDAAIIAEEGIWKIPRPGGVGDRGGGNPPEYNGSARRFDAATMGSRAPDRGGGGLRGLAVVCAGTRRSPGGHELFGIGAGAVLPCGAAWPRRSDGARLGGFVYAAEQL